MLPLPETSRARLLQARALQARLEASPGEATPDDVVELARLGLGDLGLYERLGADGVGTDAYPALRDAVPALRITVERGSPDARRAAAYALAFVFEHLPETAELLARRAGAETDTTTKASITLALARTRGRARRSASSGPTRGNRRRRPRHARMSRSSRRSRRSRCCSSCPTFRVEFRPRSRLRSTRWTGTRTSVPGAEESSAR